MARKVLALLAPLSGRTVALEEVPDPVFAEKMMGHGIAIDPAAGEVRAPLDGRVEVLFPAGHAVGIRTAEGAEVLVHVGIESVKLTGVFTPCVCVGAEVKARDLLIRFDLDELRCRAASPITPVLVTTLPAGFRLETTAAGREVRAGKDQVATLTQPGGVFAWLTSR